MGFRARLATGFAAGKHLCVGVDPHAHLLADWQLPDSAVGVERFGREIVAAAAASEAVLAIKPQVAFFERFGSAGFMSLERVLQDARAAGLLVIADVKRGDIGSSFAAYAQAWLAPGSALECDAMTAVAYQGFGSLQAGLEMVEKHDKGLFVLAATSNPEAKVLQQAKRFDGTTVAAATVKEAIDFNTQLTSESTALENTNVSPVGANTGDYNAQVGAVGVVLGATLQLADFGIDIHQKFQGPVLPILAPGFGAQGAKLQDAKLLFGNLSAGLISNESRSILTGGLAGLTARITARAAAVSEALHA